MVKVKNKRNSGLADKVRVKREGIAQKKVLNPFEVHINREKFKVLGKKTKHDRGLPGVSRAKAIQKRKDTLGVEMKLMGKSNTFVDRRIGEKDNQLSGEDKIVARFAAERAKQHSRKTMFNLADDEVLTHRGQTLEEVEKFEDPRSSDEEDDDGRKFGGLRDEFVAEGHFGGGMLARTDAKDGAKSHKDLIEQLIAESKKRKAEKQKLREQTLDLTEKLDTDWKDLQPIVFKRARTDPDEPSLIDKLLSKDESRGADYDKMMRELKFEKRGTPSDGLKSEEALAKEQKQKLEVLERERQERMHGIISTNISSAASKHRSADDLDDNFELDNEPSYMVAYDKDGKPLVPEHVLKENSLKEKNKEVKFNEGVSDSSDDESNGNNDDDEESGDSDEESGAEDDLLNDLKDTDSEISDDEDVNNSPEDVCTNGVDVVKNNVTKEDVETKTDNLGSKKAVKRKNNEDEEAKSNKVTRQSESSDKGIVNGTAATNKIKVRDQSILFENNILAADSERTKEDDKCFNSVAVDEQIANQIKADLLARKVIMEQARKELPYTYEMPEEYEQLEELLSEKQPEYQAVVLERLIKCYHASLGENNKELLSHLFAFLLQYVNDLFSDLKEKSQVVNSFKTFDKIAPLLYDLAQMNVMNAKKCLTEVIVEKYEDFKKNPKRVPDLDTLIFFKLVSLIFPTSDFRHPVVTPCLVFMSDILTRCRYRDTYSVSRGLFLTALILEYTVLSKRFVPSAINFIRGILYLSTNTSILNPIQVVPPFKLFGKESKMLVLDENCSQMNVSNKMEAGDLVLDKVDDSFKIRCLCASADMLKEMFTVCNDLETQECMFEPHIKLLGLVDFDNYPKAVAKNIGDMIMYMRETLEMKTYSPLTREKKRPKALKLYEPDVQDVFTGNKSSKLTREQAERDKLKYRLRRETKGALREIRRDKAYVGAVKIRQKIQSDVERKAKVKRIYAEASVQQGELNKLKRIK